MQRAVDVTTLPARAALMNVYIQNHRLDPNGQTPLPTYCRGDVHFHHLPIWKRAAWLAAVFAGLRDIGWAGHFTIHQAEGIETAETPGMRGDVRSSFAPVKVS